MVQEKGPVSGLIVVPDDSGGSLHALARYLRRRNLAELRVMSLDPDLSLGCPRDLHEVPDGGREAAQLIEGCQLLHAVDCDPEAFVPSDSPLQRAIEAGSCQVSLQLDGSLGPAQNENLLYQAKKREWSVVSTLPKLSREYGLSFLPPFVPWWEGPYQPLLPGTRGREATQRPTLVQVATRCPLERMPVLEDMADAIEDAGLSDVVVEVLSGAPLAKLRSRRRWAHLSLCPGEGGLSRGVLEALAAGVPVVSALQPEDLALYQDLYLASHQGKVVEVGEVSEAGDAGERAPDPAHAHHPLVSPESMIDFIRNIQPRKDGDPFVYQWARRILDPKRWESYFESILASRPGAQAA